MQQRSKISDFPEWGKLFILQVTLSHSMLADKKMYTRKSKIKISFLQSKEKKINTLVFSKINTFTTLVHQLNKKKNKLRYIQCIVHNQKINYHTYIQGSNCLLIAQFSYVVISIYMQFKTRNFWIVNVSSWTMITS